MENNNDWETIHSQHYRNNDTPIPPIIIHPPLDRHVIEVLAFADSIPKTWRSAGRIQCTLENPNTTAFPRTTAIENVPVNVAKVFRIPKDTEYYWLQYHPHHWYIWQTLTIKTWIYG